MGYFRGLLIYKKIKRNEQENNIDRNVNNTYIYLLCYLLYFCPDLKTWTSNDWNKQKIGRKLSEDKEEKLFLNALCSHKKPRMPDLFF